MTDSVKLKKYLDNIPKKQYPIIRKRIEKRCGVTTAAVNHWINGRNKIPLLAKKEIERIAKQKIFEP